MSILKGDGLTTLQIEYNYNTTEQIFCVFSQVLASLRTVRNNFAALTNVQQERANNKYVAFSLKY